MNALQIVQLLQLVVSIATEAGINIARFNQMREESGGDLTDEQVQELLNESQDEVDRL